MLLLVEDHLPTMRALLRAIGRRCEVETAATLAAAKTAIARSAPDALILDLVLPDGSGLDLVAFARERRPCRWSPIAVVTGTHDATLVGAATRLRTFFFLKPLGIADLDWFLGLVGRSEGEIRLEAAVRRACDAAGLTPRQREIVRFCVAGNAISSFAGISENTVREHVKEILARTDAADTASLVLRIHKDALDRGDA